MPSKAAFTLLVRPAKDTVFAANIVAEISVETVQDLSKNLCVTCMYALKCRQTFSQEVCGSDFIKNTSETVFVQWLSCDKLAVWLWGKHGRLFLTMVNTMVVNVNAARLQMKLKGRNSFL